MLDRVPFRAAIEHAIRFRLAATGHPMVDTADKALIAQLIDIPHGRTETSIRYGQIALPVCIAIGVKKKEEIVAQFVRQCIGPIKLQARQWHVDTVDCDRLIGGARHSDSSRTP